MKNCKVCLDKFGVVCNKYSDGQVTRLVLQSSGFRRCDDPDRKNFGEGCKLLKSERIVKRIEALTEDRLTIRGNIWVSSGPISALFDQVE